MNATEPIRIHCHPAIGINGWTITITPDLARRIVELARTDITTTNPDGSLKPVALRLAADGSVVDAPSQPKSDAGDDAAVGSMSYRGNTVSFIYDKMQGRGAAIDRLRAERDKALSDLAACRACDDQHVRDLEACHKVQEELRAELAKEKERRERAEEEASDCNALCAEIDADSPDECIREVQYMRRDIEEMGADLAAATARAEGMERAGAEQARRADQNYADLIALTAQRDRLAGLLAEARGKFEAYEMDVDEPPTGPHRNLMERIDAALAELEKNK